MKKHLISLGLACAMVFTLQCFADDDGDANNNKKEQKEQQAKLEKQRKKEEKLRKQEMSRLEEQKRKEREEMEREERKHEAELKKEEKLRKQEMKRLEKQKRKEREEVEREERKHEAELKKEEAKMLAEEKKKRKELEKEQKEEARKLEKQKRKEREEMEREERKQQDDEKKEEKLRKQEMKRLEEQKRKEREEVEREERKHEAELKKEEAKILTEEKKKRKELEKEQKEEARKLEKQKRKEREEMEREERKHEAELKKEEAKILDEEKKMRKELEKEQKRKNEKLARIKREEKHRLKKLNKEKKAHEKRERRHLETQKYEEEMYLLEVNEKTSQEEKLAKNDEEKTQAHHLTANWKNSRKEAVVDEYKNGKYADLQILPAWPFYSWFFNEKAMINIDASYWYATDSYISDGSNRNITALDFGDQAIKLQDILLASKLLGQGTVSMGQTFPPAGVPAAQSDICPLFNNNPSTGTASTRFVNNFIGQFYDSKINFIGKSEKYGLEFDFARHVLHKDIKIGVQVPVLYIKNHLRASMHFPTSVTNLDSLQENTSLYFKEELRRVLESKGIKELGGSAIGLGDITLFGNFDITTKYVDKIVVGLKVGLPTGKSESMYKLWAPSLSANDKCTEVAVFASMLLNYKTYVNPHLSLQVSFFSTTPIKRRVPHIVSSSPNAIGGTQVGNSVMAMGDRVLYPETGVIAFSEYDSTVRGFADHPVRVKFQKGTEFHVRLGNVFENFLSRRGFFDIYYDLRAKLEDDFSGLNRSMYGIGKMKADTKSIENRIGMEYTQQFDSATYFKARLNYSFSGVNAPKVFDIGLSLGHSF